MEAQDRVRNYRMCMKLMKINMVIMKEESGEARQVTVSEELTEVREEAREKVVDPGVLLVQKGLIDHNAHIIQKRVRDLVAAEKNRNLKMKQKKLLTQE